MPDAQGELFAKILRFGRNRANIFGAPIFARKPAAPWSGAS